MKPQTLGELPEDVIRLILTLLPIKEVARTSILSTQWRHLWRTIPHLVFDRNFASSSSNSDSDSNSETESELDENETKKVMLKVHEALMGHERSSLNTFELEIPGMRRCPQIHQLIGYLSTKHVKTLTLGLSSASTELLPCSILYYPDLEVLRLQGFKFDQPPWSVGFSKLVNLDLEDLILPNNFYKDFLPLCPLLQDLMVVNSIVDNMQPPVFVAPSLRFLFFASYFDSICFKYTPCLSALSILDADDIFYGLLKNHDDMVSLFAALPALQELNIGLQFLQFLSEGLVPYQLPASLHNLKILEAPLVLLDRLPEVQVLLCLIRSSPNLQKLTVVFEDDDDENDSPDSKQIDSLQKLLEPEDAHCVCYLQRLEELNMKNSRATRVETDLARFVLATALELKRVFIEPREDLKPNTMVEFAVEVMHCKKISKGVACKYVLSDRVLSL